MRKAERLLVVVAHADDMEFMAAGTLARLIGEQGIQVYEYILTDNRMGSYYLDQAELVRRSEEEARTAGAILGLEEVRFEGYPDARLNETSPNVLREKIMAVIREVRADIVMSWDPFAPGEDHPDHRMVAMATFEAASFSGNPKFHPEHHPAPWPVREAYWFAKHPAGAALFVDISSVMEIKLKALLAHTTQMELTLDGLRQEAEAAGLDLELPTREEPDQYQPLLEMAMRSYCQEIGAQAGLAYAEQFRHERYGYLSLITGEALEDSSSGLRIPR